MKILHLNTDAQIAGAGIAAYRLHKGLRALGVDSMMLVNKARQQEKYIITPSSTSGKIAARLYPMLDRIPGKLSGLPLDRISSSWMPDGLLRRGSQLQPDVLNLHWVNDGFMQIEMLPRFRQPIIWTLHDMWPFAGGEHYVGESVRYKEGYTSLNRPESETGLDVNRWIWQRKKKSWRNMNNLVIASPSSWLAKCAAESALFRDLRIEVLPNGVDDDRFHPMDHAVVRRILGLPEDKKLILFCAGSATTDKRKGYHLLVEALKKLETQVDPEDYALLVVGASSGANPFSIQTHFLGTLHDEISMALVYAAADVFVAPSTEENLANTVLESLSCGTPVVAFEIGGMPDMIVHKKNGYLASAFDTSDLAGALMWILKDKQRWKSLSTEARNTVVRSFSLRDSSSRYMSLYEDMLGKQLVNDRLA